VIAALRQVGRRRTSVLAPFLLRTSFHDLTLSAAERLVFDALMRNRVDAAIGRAGWPTNFRPIRACDSSRRRQSARHQALESGIEVDEVIATINAP
jgi:hypothetical protein